MGKTLTGLVLAALLAATTAAHGAEPTASQLIKAYDSGELDREYVALILVQNENGLRWANMRLYSRDEPPIYCMPDNQAVTGEQLLDMMRHEVKANERFGQMPYGLAVMRVMEKKYPCIASGRQE